MLIETVKQGKQKLGQGWTRTKQTVTVMGVKVGAFCQDIYNQLANSVRFVIDYVSPQVKDADETETEWITNGAASVLNCIQTDDPMEAYCQMSPERRIETLENIAVANANLMGIKPCQFQISDELPANVMGVYDSGNRIYTINAALVYAQPITRETAKRAIMNVIHEMFHAFQYTAMYQPHKYGIPEEVAAIWRENARNYSSFQMNPSFYYLQPLESYARYVQEGVMEWLRDPDMVTCILSQLN